MKILFLIMGIIGGGIFIISGFISFLKALKDKEIGKWEFFFGSYIYKYKILFLIQIIGMILLIISFVYFKNTNY